ncbi:hypothetical protein [Nocardia tengchongensis]|uniref:hypothetical protein n=1 Tax=Nocardia tengchongensis TaxID=2055889 RepID=UPI0036AD80F0
MAGDRLLGVAFGTTATAAASLDPVALAAAHPPPAKDTHDAIVRGYCQAFLNQVDKFPGGLPAMRAQMPAPLLGSPSDWTKPLTALPPVPASDRLRPRPRYGWAARCSAWPNPGWGMSG